MALQPIDPVAETPAHGDELQKKVWLSPKEVLAYLDLTANAFFMFRQRTGLRCCYRYRRTEIDAIVERENRLRDVRKRRRGAALRASQRSALDLRDSASPSQSHRTTRKAS